MLRCYSSKPALQGNGYNSSFKAVYTKSARASFNPVCVPMNLLHVLTPPVSRFASSRVEVLATLVRDTRGHFDSILREHDESAFLRVYNMDLFG